MSCSPRLLETGCGTARETSSFESGRRAAAQAVSAVTDTPLSVVMVFASVRYELDEALRGVRSITGAAPLIGATTAGEICNGLHGGSITVTVLASPYLQLRYAVGAPVSAGWRAAVEQAAGSPELAPYFPPSGEIDHELARQGKSLFGVLFSPGTTRTATSASFEIMELLTQRSLGRIPFFGGSAADDWRLEGNAVLAGDHAVADGLLVAVFETQLRFGISLAHGYRPSDRTATVSGVNGREVYLLGGVPLAGFCSFVEQGVADDGVSRHKNGAIGTLVLGRELSTAARVALENERLRSDIAERRRREEELVRSLRLAEAASRAKSAFLTTMSHELRTPLNSILGMCEMLREEVGGAVSNEQRHFLSVIDESGRHLLALINDVLDLSRIEADKMEPEFAPLSVADLCRSSLTFISEPALKRRIAVTLSLKQIPDQIVSDQRRLKQILINLLGNAVKFTPEGGTVDLDVVGDPESQELRFTVRDTGIGIASSDLKKLFHPFVQVDSTLARRAEGTGLGLTLVARLAELLGGTVAVASEPGKGSSFTVTLPWRDRGAEPASAAPAPDPSLAAPPVCGPFADEPLILLADDNRASSEMVSGYLRAKGCRVITAETGVEAVELAGEQRPDLILMDVQMPVLDGLAAIREIRGFPPPASAVPIIALTALAMSGDRMRCLEAGADVYLEKPIAMRELVEQIGNLVTVHGSAF